MHEAALRSQTRKRCRRKWLQLEWNGTFGSSSALGPLGSIRHHGAKTDGIRDRREKSVLLQCARLSKQLHSKFTNDMVPNTGTNRNKRQKKNYATTIMNSNFPPYAVSSLSSILSMTTRFFEAFGLEVIRLFLLDLSFETCLSL